MNYTYYHKNFTVRDDYPYTAELPVQHSEKAAALAKLQVGDPVVILAKWARTSRFGTCVKVDVIAKVWKNGDIVLGNGHRYDKNGYARKGASGYIRPLAEGQTLRSIDNANRNVIDITKLEREKEAAAKLQEEAAAVDAIVEAKDTQHLITTALGDFMIFQMYAKNGDLMVVNASLVPCEVNDYESLKSVPGYEIRATYTRKDSRRGNRLETHTINVQRIGHKTNPMHEIAKNVYLNDW